MEGCDDAEPVGVWLPVEVVGIVDDGLNGLI